MVRATASISAPAKFSVDVQQVGKRRLALGRSACHALKAQAGAHPAAVAAELQAAFQRGQFKR
jgi:hypothetical protein